MRRLPTWMLPTIVPDGQLLDMLTSLPPMALDIIAKSVRDSAHRKCLMMRLVVREFVSIINRLETALLWCVECGKCASASRRSWCASCDNWLCADCFDPVNHGIECANSGHTEIAIVCPHCLVHVLLSTCTYCKKTLCELCVSVLCTAGGGCCIKCTR